MNIQGLQKLTLLDYPEHVAATLFTGGCQLNCPYCHNSELISGPFGPGEDTEAVLAFLKKRQGLLDGVCVSGGEPLLQPDIADFLRAVKALGYQIKLDTNGGFPEKLAAIVGENLVDYVAMDIKNTPARYPETVGVPDLDVTPYIRSQKFLMEGHVDFEFRTTVVREYHTIEDIRSICEWLQGAPRYYLQCFVARDQVRDISLSAYNDEEMRTLLAEAKKYLPVTELRGI